MENEILFTSQAQFLCGHCKSLANIFIFDIERHMNISVLNLSSELKLEFI